MNRDTRTVAVVADGRALEIEYAWIAAERSDRPLLIFLHEGLGSVSMWRAFPALLCEAIGCRGLVYSRPGYGWSTPRATDERWPPDFMHRQADTLLPALLTALGIDTRAAPVWLFGHSDGGSIALLHAARLPDRVAGMVVVAPHIMVEPISIESIARARDAWFTTDLRARLARHHADPDSAFFGWNDAWLDPAFRDWRLDAEIARIRCPVLAVQGLDDEYGTLEQIRGIARLAPRVSLLELPDCGHSPHRDQPARLIDATAAFFDAHQPTSKQPHQPRGDTR